MKDGNSTPISDQGWRPEQNKENDEFVFHALEIAKKKILGTLGSDQVRLLRNQFEEDPQFANEVRQCEEFLLHSSREFYKEKLESLMEAERLKRKRLRRASWTTAAAVLLIAGSWLFWPRPMSNLQLFKAYFEFPVSVDRGGEEVWSHDWDAVRDLYDSSDTENLEVAIVEFQRLLKQPMFREQHGGEASLYLGVAYLETGKIDSAILVLDEVPSWDWDFYEAAVWVKTMARVKQGDRDGACTDLVMIRNSERLTEEIKTKAASLAEDLSCI